MAIKQKTKLYYANSYGWMTVIEAPNQTEALRIAKDRAEGASLLRSDITTVRLATPEEIEWYQVMSGSVEKKMRKIHVTVTWRSIHTVEVPANYPRIRESEIERVLFFGSIDSGTADMVDWEIEDKG